MKWVEVTTLVCSSSQNLFTITLIFSFSIDLFPDVKDGRKSPSSDPLLESALPKEEKTDEPKISILRSKRNKIMLGIALTVLLIIGITIVVWFLTSEEPDFDTFDGKSPPPFANRYGTGFHNS